MELVEHFIVAFAGAALGYIFARILVGAVD